MRQSPRQHKAEWCATRKVEKLVYLGPVRYLIGKSAPLFRYFYVGSRKCLKKHRNIKMNSFRERESEFGERTRYFPQNNPKMVLKDNIT